MSSSVVDSILPASSISDLYFNENINLYDEIRDAQRNDNSLSQLIEFPQHQKLPNVSDTERFPGLARLHRVIDGALYRVFRSRSSTDHTQPSSSLPLLERIALVIPMSHRLHLLELVHVHAMSAHLDRHKT